MKSFKVIMAVVATTALISVALVAHAGEAKGCDQDRHHQRGDLDKDDMQPGSGKHMYSERRHAPFDKILDLTDAQKQTLETARAQQQTSQQAFHEKLRAAHEALDKAGDANADDASLSKLSNELASLIAQQEVNRIKERRQFLSLLTAEQKQKLDAFEAEHKGPRQWKQKRQDTAEVK